MVSPKSIAVRLLALAFSLWLGGVGCLTGCARMLASSDASAVEAGSHACCHQKKKADSAATDQIFRTSATTTCCPLAGLAGALSSKQRIREITVFRPVPTFTSIDKTLPSDSAFPIQRIRIPDRSGTYLTNCTFLI